MCCIILNFQKNIIKLNILIMTTGNKMFQLRYTNSFNEYMYKGYLKYVPHKIVVWKRAITL